MKRAGLVAFVVLAVAATARAQSNTPERRSEIGNFTLIGVRSVDEGDLRSVLGTQEGSWLPWRHDALFDREVFERDLDRIVAYYRDRGFPEAKVVSHDIDFNEQDNEVNLTVHVEEGPATLISAVRFEGFDVAGDDFEDFAHSVPIKAGQPVVHQAVLTAGEMAVNVLRDHGYPYARVGVTEERAGPHDVLVLYEAIPGPLALFGPIEITGNSSVSDSVIRRQLAYRPGEMFRRRLIRESQRRLSALELFDFVNIDALTGEEARGEGEAVPTRITVVEGKHRRILFSAGYGTEEKFRVEGTWRHANFYGGARQMDLRGKWSSIERGGEVELVQPYPFGRNLTVSIKGHGWYADEPAYTLLSRGGRATVTRRRGLHATFTLAYAHQYERSTIANEALLDLEFRDELIALGLDPTTGVQDGTLSSLVATAEYSTVENLLDPARGYFASLSLEKAGGLLPGTFNYYGVSAEARHYLPIGSRLIWANRVRAGSIDPGSGLSDVPFAKRYFLGGSTSLRGWGRFQVAPLSGFGLPIGGFSMMEVTTEARFDAWKNLGFVAFVDAGNVWTDSWEFRPGDFVYDIGPGLRYQTPVGPVRVDLAWQLTPIDGLRIDGEPERRRWRVHFAIGASF